MTNAGLRLIAAMSTTLLIASSAWTAENAGVVLAVKGDVQMFTDPSTKADGPSPRVLYENVYYTARPLKKIGQSIINGQVLRTGPDGKLKIALLNGDTLNVGPASTLQLKLNNKPDSKEPNMINLMYGRLRSTIKKGGDNANLKIVTPAAVAGVRGTDFFVQSWPVDNSTKVTVMRGEVALTPETADKSVKVEPVAIKTGYAAEYKAPLPTPTPAQTQDGAAQVVNATPPPAPVIEVKPATKEEFVEVQKLTHISKEETQKLINEAPPEVKKEIEKLEQTAVKSVMEDIKATDPVMFAKLSQEKTESVADVNAAVVGQLFKEAPAAPAKKKPSMKDLQDLDDDVYKKYFKED